MRVYICVYMHVYVHLCMYTCVYVACIYMSIWISGVKVKCPYRAEGSELSLQLPPMLILVNLKLSIFG